MVRTGMAAAQLMVLCAGSGTRLLPLTQALPKPLVPLGDRPVLAHILDESERQGLSTVVVNGHHQIEALAEFVSGRPNVLLSREQELLGTAGGVRAARSLLSASCVVWNGDIMTRPPLVELLSAAEHHQLVLLVSTSAGPGTLGLDAAGRVVRLRGERFGDEQRAVDYVGVIGLGHDALSALPERGCLVGDLCLPWLRAGHEIQTVELETAWLDVGTLLGYGQAQQRWLTEQGVESWCGANVTLAPSVIAQRSVIMAGARVRGAGALRRCVVWPGADVEAPLQDAVVLGPGRVVELPPNPSQRWRSS